MNPTLGKETVFGSTRGMIFDMVLYLRLVTDVAPTEARHVIMLYY